MPGDLAGHRFTRPEGRVQCESILIIHPHLAQMPGGPLKTDERAPARGINAVLRRY